MADLFRELEYMASNAAYTLSRSDTEITSADVERWTKLFGLSPAQAKQQIAEHRNGVERKRASNELWEEVKEEKAKEGYDREAWEFSLQHPALVRPYPADSTSLHEKPGRVYALKLEDPLSSIEKVQHIAGLGQTPYAVTSTDKTGEALFCRIDEQTRQTIVEWLARSHPDFTPTFIHLEIPDKDFGDTSTASLPRVETTTTRQRDEESGFVTRPSLE